MQNRKSPVRRSSRFPVGWPMRYGNATFLAEGTVLDLTARGWRVVGTMPVVAGMQLTLQVSVPERPTLLRVQRATVLWVKDHEFAIEVQDLEPMDQAWVSEFLHHKLGLKWMSRATHPEASLATVLPNLQRALPPRGIPSLEDIFQHLLDLQIDSTHRPAEARGKDDSDSEEGGSDASCDEGPEKLWREAHRILRAMRVIHMVRAGSDRDVIAEN
ncbi:MAG: hypothetical protein OEY60_04820 [Nitrospira sp.]|nr:hypothetical protein [Nitrospira sp.]MDH5497160.1 hypothetical protein [Nitrospira sp.]MDH5724777.1 hypothetical protein [Nitrospira sp.]